MKKNVIAFILAKNEEGIIAECIRSIKKNVDIVVVGDMASNDNTAEIAKINGAVVLNVNDTIQIDKAKDDLINKFECEIVVLLDADETVSSELISESLYSLNNGYDVCFIKRTLYVKNKEIKYCGWQNEYLPRIYRRGHVEHSTDLHTPPKIYGKSKYIYTKDFKHYWANDYFSIIIKHNRYLFSQSQTLIAKNVYNWRSRPLKALAVEFLRRYIRWFGFLDGRIGIHICILSAFDSYRTALLVEERRSSN